MKNFFLICLLVAIGMNVRSQDSVRTHQRYFQSLNAVGLLEGEKGSAFQLQTVNGMRYGKWFAGIGLGIDYYRVRTIPLFADVRRYFGRSRNNFFVYINGGLHYPWPTSTEKDFYSQGFTNGFYTDIGIGYQLTFRGGNGVLLSAGYSYKYTQEKIGNTYGVSCPFYGPCYPTPIKVDYNLNRISFKLGFAL